MGIQVLENKAEDLERRIRSIETGSFQEEEKQIEIKREIQNVLTELSSHKDFFDQKIEDLARVDPPSAVIEVSLQLERVINRAVIRLKIISSSSNESSISYLVDLLADKKYIDLRTADLVKEIYELRNRAVHTKNPNITYADAIEYASLAKRIILKIASI